LGIPRKRRKSWAVGIVAGVWASTALAVLALTWIHPSALTSVSLTVSEFSFNTNSGVLLSDAYEEQLLISGIAALDVSGADVKMSIDDRPAVTVGSIKLSGDPSFSCSFYHVRSSRPELSGLSRVTISLPPVSVPGSFSIKSHGSITGRITSQPRTAAGASSRFGCTQALLNGEAFQHVDGEFSTEGGDSADFRSAPDVRIDFRGAMPAHFVDTQIPIFDEIRFSTVRPGLSTEEKTTLLPPPSGLKNEVLFEQTNYTVSLNDGDLLVIDPASTYYLKKFSVEKEGITLGLGGEVKHLGTGPGSSALHDQMPSVLDRLDTKKKIFGLVPALAALIFGILDKMGVPARKWGVPK